MNGTNNSNDINVQSAADMGFGGGFGGNVNVGAAMDATDSLGGNLGLTDARGFDLGGQVAVGPSTGMPGGGQFSKAGGIVGGIMGALVGAPVQGVLAGGYGVGPVNDLFGWSSSKPELPDMGMGAATYGGSSGNAGTSSGGAINELFRPEVLGSGAATSSTATSDEASRWVAAGLLDATTGQPTAAGWQAINATRAQAQPATGTYA